MEKLYYIDEYIKEFKTEITNIIEKGDKYYVALEESAFFEGGGGQPSDTGFIDNHKVIDIIEEDGVIYHITETKPIKIHKVSCKIDWEKRYDFMQQHLAQHALSGCFFKLFNKNTCGIHLGKDISTIDIEGTVTEEEIRKAEKMVNQIIFENREVKTIIPTKSELKKLKIRRALPNTKEDIRVVIIEDLDINACCGVHVKSTIELQAITLKRFEKHKGNTRIEYLAGNRAIKDYLNKDSFSRTICRSLSCSEDETLNSLNKLNDKIKELSNENKNLRIELDDYKVKEFIEKSEKVNNITIIKEIFKEDSIKNISKLTNRLLETDNIITLFAIENEDKANLIFGASKNIKNIDMNILLKDAISLIDGRGGGSKFLSQGGGKNNNNLKGTLDYAFKKIENNIK